MKKTIQPIIKPFGNYKRTRRYTVLARWNRRFKMTGVTVCSLALGMSLMDLAGQAPVTYGAGNTVETGNTAEDVTLVDSARVELDSAGFAGPPNQTVYPNQPSVSMGANTLLNLRGASEIFTSLNSTASDSQINTGGNNLGLNLAAGGLNEFAGGISNAANRGVEAGTPPLQGVIGSGGVLNITGDGEISFNGLAGSLDLEIANPPGNTNNIADPATLSVGIGTTVNTAEEVISDGASVLVGDNSAAAPPAATLNLLGAETLTDLCIELNGVVNARGVLSVLDVLKVNGELNTSEALCVVNLSGMGTINAGGDVLLAPSANSSLGIVFNLEDGNDFLKFGDADLTLTANQGIEGSTWVQGGSLTLDGTSVSDHFIVSGDIESFEATGAIYDGGGVYNEAVGNVPAADLSGKAGTVAPVLTLENTSVASEITIGSVVVVDLDGDTVGDAATLFTVGNDRLLDTAQVNVFNNGNLNLGGSETLAEVTFADTELASAEAISSVRGQITLGGVTTIETLRSGYLGDHDSDPGTPDQFIPTPNGIANLGGNTLNLAGGGSSYEYSGIFTGTVASTLNKNGAGELILTGDSATDSVASPFAGSVNVAAGALDVRNDGGLGITGAAGGAGARSASGESNVASGAELQFNGTRALAENINIAGCGLDGMAGAIHIETGTTALSGQLTLDATSSLFAADGTSLATSGLITAQAATDPRLFLAGDGDFDVNGQIDGNISSLYKTGTGEADISALLAAGSTVADHGYQTGAAGDGVADTLIQDGTLRIDNVGDLGGANADVLAFVGDTNNAEEAPTLDYRPAAASGQVTLVQSVVIDSSLGDSKFATGTRDTELDVAFLNIDDQNGVSGASSDSSLRIDIINNPVVFAHPSSGLYKTGGDDLLLDATSAPTDPLLVNTTSLGGVLNPGDVVDSRTLVDGPGASGNGANCFGAVTGSVNFEIAGLGYIDAVEAFAGTNSSGTLELTNFDNLIVSQVTDTTFNGSLNTAANFLYSSTNGSTLTLGGSALGTGFIGQTYISNGRLIATSDNALGSFVSDFDSQATFICGTHQTSATSVFDPAADLNFGILELSGGAHLSENITLVNDGHLVSNTGENSIRTAVRLQYDPTTDVLPGDAAYATIGAEGDSTLTLLNGVFNETGTNVGLRLNTGTVNRDQTPGADAFAELHTGTLKLGAIARDSVQDVIIGHADSTGTTVLLTDNAHEGQTYLMGGMVEARTAGAFSGGNVIVDGDSTLNGSTSIGNDIQLNAELTTTSDNSDLRLDGEVSGVGSLVKEGTGTLTLAGNNLYTGSTTVEDGTLDVSGSLASAMIAVDGGVLNARGSLAATDIDIASGGNLETFGDEFLSDAAAVDVDGTLTLGGNETINELTGAGSVEAGSNNLTASSGNFSGVINGTGDLIKDGNGTLTLSGTSGYTGETDVLDGVLTIDGGSLVSNEIAVANNAVLNLQNGAQFAANSELVNNGLVNVTGANEIGLLVGAATGEISIGDTAADELTVLGGVYDGTITGGGSLMKDGAGTLVLNNGSAHTGATTVDDGVLRIGGTLASNEVNVSSGASLQTDWAELLANGSTVDVDGTLTLGGDDTIGDLDATGIVNGIGTLTASTYDLNGATVDADLGTGTLNSDGATALNGTSAAGTVNVNTGTLTLGGADRLADNATVDVDGTLALNGDDTIGDLDASGTISGTGTLTANTYDLNGATVDADLGTGTLNSDGATALNGTSAAEEVNVNSGTLTLGGADLLADNATVGVDGTLAMNGDEAIGNLDASGTINGTGTLTADTYDLNGADVNVDLGAGTLNSIGATSLDGTSAAENVNVTGGTLSLVGADSLSDDADVNLVGNLDLGGSETISSLSGTGGVTTASGETLTVSSGNYGGNISGAGSLTKEDSGTLSLTGTNTYTGATQINGGIVQLDGTLASTNITVDGSTLILGSAERINDDASLTVTGSGLLVLNGDETVGTANLGTQSVSGTGNLIAGATTLSGTTLDAGLNSSGLVSTTGSGSVTTINAASSASSLIVADETTLLLNAALDTDSIAVNGPAGVLTTGSGNLINDTAVVDIDGTLNLGGDEAIGGLTGIGDINVGNNTLEVDGDGTFAGELVGSGNLVTGGDLTLSGESSLSGDLDVEDGTLALTGSIDSSNVDVDSDAVLALSNGGSLQDDSAVNVDGTLTLADDETIGSLAASGAVNGAGTLTAATYELDGATVGANLGAGSLTSNAATTLSGTSAASTVDVESGTLTLGSANRLDDSAAVDIDGTLALNGDDTVGVVDASGSISGSGTLTASAYNLDGALVSANLGAGVLNSSGNTQLDGTSAAVGVNVIDGTLTLGSAQRFLSTAVVDVDGNLVLGGAETIGELTGTGAVDAGGHTFTIADGGDFSGGVSGTGSLVSNGALSLTGENSFSGDLDVNAGRLDLVGRIAALNVDVSSGAELALRGVDSLSDSSAVNVSGTLGVNDDETVGSLAASGTVDGSGTLTAATYDLTGATVNANLGAGILNTSGATSLNGTSGAGTVNVLGGTLTLGGAEALLDTAVVSLSGDLDLGGSEAIGALSGSGDVLTEAGETLTVSSGSFAGDINGLGGLAKAGSGLLTLENGASYHGDTIVEDGALTLEGVLESDHIAVAAAAQLNVSGTNLLDDSVVLVADGDVLLSGNETIQSLYGSGSGQVVAFGGGIDLNIQNNGNFDGDLDLGSGTLTVRDFVSGGELVADTVELNGGALVLNGSYDYNRLQGEGTVVADLLANEVASTIAPGDSFLGVISVTGDYSERGTYEADITAAESDTIVISGVALIDRGSAILDVDDASGVTDPLGSRVNVVSAAGGIEGGFFNITGNATARLLFDIGNGDVTSLGIDSFAELDENQLAIVNEILDSSIDGVNFDSTSGAGEILDTFILSGGDPGDSLDSLSPEAYAGGLDHVMIATRRMAETVRSAPALVVVGADQSVMEELPGDSKGRGFRPAFELPDNIAMEVIGGYSSFSTGSDSSNNGGDYDLQSQGGYAGLRMHTADGLLSLGTYVGFDGASIDGGNINLEGDGMVWGAFASLRPMQNRKLEIWSELAYGTYEYDASHSSVGGMSSGNVEATAFDFGIGTSYLAYQRDGFTLSPSTGLRYVDGNMDSFSEVGGVGALNVDGMSASSVLFDLGLEMSFVPVQNDKFGITGYLGWQHDFSDTEREVSAAFAGGESFSVNAPGLGSDAFMYSIGAYCDITDNFRLGANYNGELRQDSQAFHGFGLNGSIGF